MKQTDRQLGPESRNALTRLEISLAAMLHRVRKGKLLGLSHEESQVIIGDAAAITDGAEDLRRACTPDGNT